MNKAIKQWVKLWDWRRQSIWEWENRITIPNLLALIDNWHYQTELIDFDVNSIDMSWYNFTSEDMYEFLVHSICIDKADLSYPIILNRKWYILDWRHRVAKALKEWIKKIKAIRILDSDVI